MKKAEKELEIILHDKVHGSSELLNFIYAHFLKYKNDIDYLDKALNKIKQKFSHFPIIINFTKDIENILNGRNQDSLSNYLIDFNKQQSQIYQTIFKNGAKYLLKHKTVLTISHSRTLIKIFEIWKKSEPNLKVIICESRPNYEGILMAKEVSKLKIKTEIITEAMSGNIIKKIDAIILGADQILPNGSIINKTGSRMLSVLAKHQHIPVYVLASSDKIVIRKTDKAKKSRTNKSTLLEGNQIKFINDDFEEIEKELITNIFTD